MVRSRWAAVAAVLAAVALVGIAGFASLQPVPAPQVRQATVVPADSPSGSISRPDVSGPSVAAVEPGRAAIAVRLEDRRASWALSTALMALGLLAAVRIGERGPGLRRLLELSIRSRTAWWRPVPGGRAPPRVRPV